ncbi:unnamed protein product [Peronospora destructor]|nr:unnamed protein product [Peronospora destructor]
MKYIKGEKNVGADAFLRMQFGKAHDQSPAGETDEIYALTTKHECVMHGPVLRQHQEEDAMLQRIKDTCLAGNNNPDYQLLPLLGCTLMAYKKRVVVPDTLREDLIA